jgi:hypothetical protein
MAKQDKNLSNEESEIKIDKFKIVDIEYGNITILVDNKEISTYIDLQDDYERNFVFNHKNKYIGKFIEVKYFGNIENYEILPIKKWTIIT